MKCEKCGKNEATMYYKETVNGVTREMHLCPECAQKENLGGAFENAFQSMNHFWSDPFHSFLGGGFGHFYNYAPVKIEYAIDRFTMEAKRQLDVLDKQLARGRFVAGEEYTIADMAIWPWYGNVVLGNVYNAAEFLDAGSYVNVLRWAQDVGNRPAVKRGRMVNRTNGPLDEQLHERHDARDFDTQTEDKRQA